MGKRNEEIVITIDWKRKNRSYLKNRDKIYLTTKNLKSKRLSRNIDYIKNSLFLILK